MTRAPFIWIVPALVAMGCEYVAGINDRSTDPKFGAAGAGGESLGSSGGQGSGGVSGEAADGGVRSVGGAGGEISVAGAGGFGEGGAAGAPSDPCVPNPCQNDASCSATASGVACDCAGPWAGQLCDLPVFEPIEDGTATEARGISADGAIVVGCVEIEQRVRAFRFTYESGLEELPLIPNAVSCEANGISGDGSVTVGKCTLGDGTTRAVSWSGEDAVSILPNDTAGNAFGTNRDGSVIVGKNSNGAFSWSGDLLSTLGSGEARATSGDGSLVVGGFPTEGQAFRYSEASARQDLQFKDFYVSSIARATDVAGTTIVGYARQQDGTSLPFRVVGATSAAVVALPGSEAYAVSADGTVLAGGGKGEAWIYREDQYAPLVTVLANVGVTTVPIDFTLDSAVAISADGLVLAGNAKANSGLRAFVVRLRAKDLP